MSSLIIVAVIDPVSPNDPAIVMIELVAEAGLTMVVEPVPWKVALDPIRSCTHLFAGTTAVPDVMVIVCVVEEKPHVSPDAALEIGASAIEAHDADVLVAKSTLVVAIAPRVQPTGNV